jgi:hypothetical protein
VLGPGARSGPWRAAADRGAGFLFRMNYDAFGAGLGGHWIAPKD